jgi:2-methylisocitrate lyase-like PEP mutase family enzyme
VFCHIESAITHKLRAEDSVDRRQIEKAETFRKLHHSGKILVLLNVWDAASARIFELAGAPAIATTSSGLAFSNGYPDGQRISRDRLVAAVRAITRVVNIPVSVDLEAGYGATPEEVRRTVAAVAEAGAIGMNIEDGSEPPALLAGKISAIRGFASESGLPMFINARVDVYLRGIGAAENRLEETMRRIRMYADAGADGAFVPGLTDSAAIATVARESPLPLNVMFLPRLPRAAELEKLGVARLSIGGAGALACMSHARRIAQELLESGTYDALLSSLAISHGEAMKMFPAD